MKNKKQTQNLIIDANNLLHRVYWIGESRGQSVNAVYLFLNSVKKYANMFKPNDIYLAWDSRLIKGIKNFRRLARDGQYKGTRDHERNKNVYNIEAPVHETVSLLGIKNIFPGIMEGDDVMSWLSENLPGNNVIVSVDQDFLQLVQETVSVYSPIKDIHITNENFEEIVGVSPKDFLSYKALIGDKSDNIPGVPKVGDKTAKKIIAAGVDTLSAEHYDTYVENVKLMDLRIGYKSYDEEIPLYEKQIEELAKVKPDMDKFKQRCEDMNMNQVVNNISTWSSTFSKNNAMNNIVENLLASL